jgi:hypothetical protein
MKYYTRFFAILAMVAVGLFFALAVEAQQTRGVILGRVSD